MKTLDYPRQQQEISQSKVFFIDAEFYFMNISVILTLNTYNYDNFIFPRKTFFDNRHSLWLLTCMRISIWMLLNLKKFSSELKLITKTLHIHLACIIVHSTYIFESSVISLMLFSNRLEQNIDRRRNFSITKR